MKNHLGTVNLTLKFLVTSLALTAGLSAEASSIFRKIKGTANSATSAVTQAGNTIATTASGEMNAVSNAAQATYASSAGEVTNGYNASVAALNAAYNSAVLAAYKQAGNAMLSPNRGKVTNIANTFRNLDDAGLAALNRIVDAIKSQQINDSVNSDMQLLGNKLGILSGANLPSNLTNSNFGIQVDSTLGLGLGFGQSYGIAMNVLPTNGRFRLALLQGKSVSVGLQADDSVGVSFFWGTGSVDDSAGTAVGLALELAVDGGAAVEMTWPAVTTISDLSKISPYPGLAIALVGGDSVKVDLVAGYTKVLKIIQIPPAPVSAPKAAGGGSGNAWDDSSQCGGQYVNGFRLRYGGSVDAVQFSYGTKGWADVHGFTGNPSWQADVSLPAGEYITAVSYAAGNMFNNVTFTSNLGRNFGPYGRGGTTGTYTVTPGERLGCMSGRSGSSVNQLTFSSTGSL